MQFLSREKRNNLSRNVVNSASLDVFMAKSKAHLLEEYLIKHSEEVIQLACARGYAGWL